MWRDINFELGGFCEILKWAFLFVAFKLLLCSDFFLCFRFYCIRMCVIIVSFIFFFEVHFVSVNCFYLKNLFFDQEITGVVNLLDPEGRRHISFEDFCKGVAQINEVQHQGKWFHDFLLSSDSLLLPTSYAARIIIRQMYIAHFYRVDLMQFPRIRTSKYRF